MTQFDKRELEQIAKERGFIVSTFEKVLRLKEILEWINKDPFLRDHLALKGGTAINLTIFSLPRLSVDIDMDYIPNKRKEEMMEDRTSIARVISSYMEGEGYTLSPSSRFYHSLDGFYYRYINASGNMDVIKLELNYSLRAHVLDPVKRMITADLPGEACAVLTLDPIEIYAAKINALLSRAAARDLYDVSNMIKSGILNGREDLLRKIVIFYSTVSQKTVDKKFSLESIDNISFQKIRRDLFPVISSDERHKTFGLDERKDVTKKYLSELLVLNDNENKYIDLFVKGIYDPGLLFDDPEILKRIEAHPMALWKCKTIEKNTGN